MASPNFDERPESCAAELLVIHGISLPPGEFGGPWIDALFSNELDADALVRILKEPRNAYTKQYAKLFEMEDVEIDFREDALTAIARRAMERKTGARGLRSILESVLNEVMYRIPSEKDVAKVIIDESVINGTSEPMLIYENHDQQKVLPE